jgi:hypothetical protein
MRAPGRPSARPKSFERGIAAAREAGDIQAAKEMEVFLKRLRKMQPG